MRIRRFAAALLVAFACRGAPSTDRVDLGAVDNTTTAGTAGGGTGKVVAGVDGPLLVAFGSMPKDARGGSVLTVTFFVEGELSSLGFALAESAEQLTTFETLATDATSFSITLPPTEIASAHLYLQASDAAGREQTVESPAFHIDAAGPAVRAVTLGSPAVTASSTVLLTISSCTDAAEVIVSEGPLPMADDPAWQPCTTRPIPYALAGEGEHVLHVWFRDALKNPSLSPADATVTLDETPPVVVLTSFAGGEIVEAGDTIAVSYQAIDAVGVASVSVEASQDGGASFTAIAGCDALPATGSCDYMTPLADVAALRFRVTAQDLAGAKTSTSSSGNVGVDFSAPTFAAGAFALDNNRSSTLNSYVNVDFIAQDTISPIERFCLQKYAVALAPPVPPAPAANDPCWQDVSVANGGLAASTRFQSSPAFIYALGPVPGTVYRVYAWVEDAVGHSSQLTNAGAGTDGTDRDAILFKPAVPPVVSSVVVTNVSPPSTFPPPPAELCFNTGSCPSQTTAHVAWKASDDLGLPPFPVALEYSTDGGLSYAPVPGASARPNDGTNGSTTCPAIPMLGAPSGCFAWTGSVPSIAFTVRVRMTDADDLVATGVSNLLNNGVLRVIAGNTDPGLPASATSVAFTEHFDPYGTFRPMAVSQNRVIFVLDPVVGLVRVHPQDGIARVFIASGPTSLPADYGAAPLAAARITASSMYGGTKQIALDYAGALLIVDGPRIRRIPNATQLDTTGLVIEPFIGGGVDTADTTTASTIAIQPLAFNSLYRMTLVPLPNGDLLFPSENDTTVMTTVRVRHYHAATGQITSVRFSGTGHSGNAAQPLATCTVGGISAVFDPANALSTLNFLAGIGGSVQDGYTTCASTGVAGEVARFDSAGVAVPVPASAKPAPIFWSMHTGRDGNTYAFSKYVTQFMRFNRASNDWTVLIGHYNVSGGNCVEGSDPAVDAMLSGDDRQCHVLPEGIDAAEDGTPYFFESGQVRVIDPPNNVHTLAGQTWSYGDGLPPLSARFVQLGWMDMWRDSGTRKIIVQDTVTGRLREFTDSNVIKVLGSRDGHSAYGIGVDIGTPPVNAAYYVGSQFAVDGTNGNVYLTGYKVGGVYSMFGVTGRGGTSTWQLPVSYGPSFYSVADGLTGSQIDVTVGVSSQVLGWALGKGLFAWMAKPVTAFAPTAKNSFYKLYDTGDSFRQSHVAGVDNPADDVFCPQATGAVAPSGATCHLPLADSLKPSYDATNDRWVTAIANGDRRILGFQPGGNVSFIAQASAAMKSFVYVPDFGGPSVPYVVYCENAATGRLFKIDQGGAQTSFVTLPFGMTCDGNAMLYDAVARSVIFTFRQNNFAGVAEYTLP